MRVSTTNHKEDSRYNMDFRQEDLADRMSLQEEGPSPSELSFDLHPFLSSIDKIASEHGLTHDSGVSFGASSSKLAKRAQEAKAMSESSSSSSLKRLGTITDEARKETKVTQSPDTTAAYDGRADVWSDVARRVKPIGDTLRHG
jgi:hypothetical protein